MKYSRLAVAVGLAAGCVAFAAEPILEYARLDLKDGRKLKNVIVKTYDAKTEKLLVIADGKAMTIPIAMVPPPFNEQLKGAPVSGSTVSMQSGPTMRTIVSAADQYSMFTPVLLEPVRQQPTVVFPSSPRASDPATNARRRRTANPEVKTEVVTPPAEDMAAHRQAALDRVSKYYRFEHRMGSNNINVTRVAFETDDPKPVTGWQGRFRTEGKAFIEFYDRIHGGSYQRTTALFEVLTEHKPGESIKNVDFIRKS